MKILKQIEWDMGHRVMNHVSKCRNLHGHRYKAEICLEGNLIDINGDSSEGMVMDFEAIKRIAVEYIQDILDHGFMIWEKGEVRELELPVPRCPERIQALPHQVAR